MKLTSARRCAYVSSQSTLTLLFSFLGPLFDAVYAMGARLWATDLAPA
jgi:hypothetical protein